MKISTGKIGTKLLWITIGTMSLMQVAFAINTLAEGFRLTSLEQQISAYSSCYYAKAIDGKEYFFPTATAVEFSAFVANKPSGVTLESCQWLYNNQHTARDCTAAGGTVYTSGGNSYCRFTSCPSGWTTSSYGDYSTNLKTCGTTGVITCDQPSGSSLFTVHCTVGGAGSNQTFTNNPTTPTCVYTSANYRTGTYQTYDYVCGNVYKCTNDYVCGGYPYTCGYKQVCGYSYDCEYKYVTHTGTICSGTQANNCQGSPYLTGRYCY